MSAGGKRVRVVTMGCSKNRVDSEHLLMQLAAAGWEVSPEEIPLEDAGVDVLVINTCGFILDAKEESVDAILEAVDAKKKGIVSRMLLLCHSGYPRPACLRPRGETFGGGCCPC